MRSKIRLIALTLALCLLAGFHRAWAKSDLDFVLANATNWPIKAVYLAPHGTSNWGNNLLKSPLQHGQELEVTFDSDLEDIESWDLRITWQNFGDSENAGDVVWKGYKLANIHKLTLHYNDKTDETSATAE